MFLIIAPTETKWIRCPFCGAKHSIYDNSAECHGVFLKCTRGCKQVFELVIEDGEQVVKK
nr:MAG TPA: cysteine-rich protein [Caudoviricetes sp.]